MTVPTTDTFVAAAAEAVNGTPSDNALSQNTNFVPASTNGMVSAPIITPPAVPETVSGFTAQQIEAAREQEKSKLYPQIEGLKDEVANLRREKEEREAADAQRQAEAEAEAQRKAEEDMSVRDLLEKKDKEWSERLDNERRERETAIALLDQERNYQELQAWKVARVEQERDNIMPELLDLVTGDTPEEINASIEGLKDRTVRILDSAQQAMSSARRDMVGSRITSPAAGPLDTDSEQRQFTPEDIKNMSLTEYQKYRTRLLGTGAASSGRGLFG